MDNPWSTERAKIPNASLKLLQRLAKTLVRDRPDITNDAVDASIIKLEAQIDETDRALANRFREINPQLSASEVEFDRATDSGWIWVRKLLEGIRDAYGHPGFEAMPEPLQLQANLTQLRDKAALAGALHIRLFGAEGTAWVNGNFMEQSETMATILRVIEHDGLTKELESVIGSELLLLLTVAQIHYEDMVSARMRRARGRADNLHVLRERLRFRLDHYKNAVELMREPDDPASHDIVAHCLRALTQLNWRINTGANAQEIADFVNAELVDLELGQDELGQDVESADVPQIQPDAAE